MMGEKCTENVWLNLVGMEKGEGEETMDLMELIQIALEPDDACSWALQVLERKNRALGSWKLQ